MNDDDPDLELEAASAAVDGLATADERALVESSPALQADVAAFARVRARLVDVSVPSAARESALTAALAAFDDLASAPLVAASAPAGASAEIVPLASRRRRRSRILAGAAAAVAVLAVGAVAIGNRDGDDDSEVSASTVIQVESPSQGDGAPAERKEDADEAGEVADPVSDAQPSDAPSGDAATDDEIGAAADDAADTGVAEAPAPAATIVIDAPASVIPAISSPEELVAYAAAPTVVPVDTAATRGAADETTAETTADTTAATTADTTAEATETTAVTAGTVVEESTSLVALDPDELCVGAETEYVGLVRYRGTLAHVLRVIDGGELRALAQSNCRLLAVATP